MSAPLHAPDSPAIRSQRAFRRIMEAMARPGQIVRIDVPVDAPAMLAPSAAAALVTLCDFETGLWLSPRLRDCAAWLRFHTDARLTARRPPHRPALVEADELDLDAFNPGTPAYPDRGATVVVQCPSLTDGPALTLAGPGIAATHRVAPAGLPAGFVAQAQANRQRFPLGVDLIFACGAELMALPRSTRIVEAR